MTERRSILKVAAPALLAAFVLSIALQAIGGFVAPSSARALNAWSIACDFPRAAVVGWAGWLVCRRGAGGLLRAGLGGVAALFVDHPIGTSLAFLIMGLVGDSSDTLMAIAGVMISFVMFAPLAFVIGVLGGVVANVVGVARAADT